MVVMSLPLMPLLGQAAEPLYLQTRQGISNTIISASNLDSEIVPSNCKKRLAH